jgi:TPR repeat protein
VKDTAQALRWLKLSADQGNPDAQLFLGLAYRNLPDVPHDFVQAYMWFQLAAQHGDPLAPRQRDDLQKLMTREQIAQARAMAAAWKPTKQELRP